jgi:CheY-like chemotaxis protein
MLPILKDMAGNLRVLIVDDDEAIREMLRAAFWNFGHVAEAVDSAEAALEVFAPDRFDAIITDSFLPGMRGEEFARIVKQQHRDMPIILITGDPTAPLPDGVDYLWHKPFQMEVLLKVLIGERRRMAGSGDRINAPI